MTRHLRAVVLASLAVLVTGGKAHATLIDQGNGLIYDSALNVTWLKDASFIAGSTYDDGAESTDGLVSWNSALAWANQLEFGGFDDWRLPAITDTGSAGCQNSFSGTDCGYNVSTSGSELAYMFHENLGNLASYDTSGVFRGGTTGVSWGLVNTGPFDNLEPQLNVAEFWSSRQDPLDSSLAWYFSFDYGYQGYNGKTGEFHAWAVRDGGVSPVPEASPTGGLMLVGLAVLAVCGTRLAERITAL